VKLPPDAVVKWLCGGTNPDGTMCSSLVGYVRRVNGVDVVRWKGLRLEGLGTARIYGYTNKSVIGVNPVDGMFRAMVFDAPPHGLDVSCGKHRRIAFESDFRRGGFGCRRVILSPPPEDK
jgi:hypothetical protein